MGRMFSRSGDAPFPPNWKRAMIYRWRTDHRTFVRGGVSVPDRRGVRPDAKNGGKKPTPWEMKVRMEALQRRVAEHPANEQSASYVSDSVSPEEEGELRGLQKEIRELTVAMSESTVENNGGNQT